MGRAKGLLKNHSEKALQKWMKAITYLTPRPGEQV
jgi:hypothetical protein